MTSGRRWVGAEFWQTADRLVLAAFCMSRAQPGWAHTGPTDFSQADIQCGVEVLGQKRVCLVQRRNDLRGAIDYDHVVGMIEPIVDPYVGRQGPRLPGQRLQLAFQRGRNQNGKTIVALRRKGGVKMRKLRTHERKATAKPRHEEVF